MSGRGPTTNQRSLHGWFRHADRDSDSFTSAAGTGQTDSTLSLLCWRYWGCKATYSGKVYDVKGLLHDPHSGTNWCAEPAIAVEFQVQSEVVKVHGNFRHIECVRMSSSGMPFTNFTCSFCTRISKEYDFRKRVCREEKSIEKRGTRTMQLGRRIDYLLVQELAFHSQKLGRQLREERALHWSMRARVAQLKMSKRGLPLSAQENFNKKDVFSFCNNILAAHRTNAFGGKPALWDFLRDVATNLNCTKNGYRYSKNTKSFCQAMKVYGGRRMCDLFILNFAAPSFSMIKRDNKKGVRFLAGEHAVIFKCVADIYVEAKALHGVHGPIPILLFEDETIVKVWIAWDSTNDELTGFCGKKDDHKCTPLFRCTVGEGEVGYKIFWKHFRGTGLVVFLE
jgi:hypothetical protein